MFRNSTYVERSLANMDGEEISHILLLYDLAPSAPPSEYGPAEYDAMYVILPGSIMCVSISICYTCTCF